MKISERKQDPTETLTTYLETSHCYSTICPDLDGLRTQQDEFLTTQDQKREMLDKHISKHSEKLDSITELPFSEMGNNEVPRDAPSASPSAKSEIPLLLDFSLDPSIFPGSFQVLTSLFQPKSMSSGALLANYFIFY